MTNYKSEQQKQDERVSNKFEPRDIRLFSILKSLYNSRGSEGDSYDPISVYKIIEERDQSLLEAFKKDVGEMIGDKMPNILHEFQREFNIKDIFFNDLPPLERRAIKNKYVEIVLSLLKDYKINK